MTALRASGLALAGGLLGLLAAAPAEAGVVGRLGRRASHGCIRLRPGNAGRLFSLVRAHGGASVVIRD